MMKKCQAAFSGGKKGSGVIKQISRAEDKKPYLK